MVCRGVHRGGNATRFRLHVMTEGLQRRGGKDAEVRITASDISEEVSEEGRRGSVSGEGLEQLPIEWREKYCHMENKHQFRSTGT